MYSVRDSQVGSFSTPYFAVDHVRATRMFGIACKDNTVQLAHYPEHFDLYFLGSWNDENGKFHLEEQPQFIVGAISFNKLVKVEKE